MFMRPRSSTPFVIAAAFFALVMGAGQALADPPSRVARLSHLGGEVSFQPAGDGGWVEAGLNRPLITGDSLYADRASRAELEIGAASIRLDERTSFRLLNLDDSFAQMEVTEGVLNLRVRRLFDGDSYEINTPTLAFVIDQPGVYRVDIAPDGSSTMVTVFEGGGSVYGENNASYAVNDRQSYRFYDSSLRDYETLDLPRQDDFDRWCFERDDRYERSVSRQYVSDEVIGYADLDDHGSWSTAPTYGSIWYPSRVDTGWAPYRNGRWTWIDPWGWSWVDSAPWGFAPFHYGRWAYVGTRWGWVPGPRNVRPIYAPALVAFVGGSGFNVGLSVGGGGPVGWFPLGPRDVYVPWYRGSRTYFNNVNVRNTTIINNTYITNVYNDYSNGRNVTNFNYAYRNNERAFTAIPRDAFVNARQVDRSLVRMDRTQVGRGEVLSRIDVRPVAASFTGGRALRGSGEIRSAAVAQRQVIARTAPAARSVGVQNRIQAIERNGNQPLVAQEMRELSARAPTRGNASAGTERVRVVGNPGNSRVQAQPLPARAAVDRAQPATAGTRVGATGNRTTPIDRAPARAPAVDRSSTTERSVAPERAARVPSSGYAPGRGEAQRAQPGATPNTRVAPQRDAAQPGRVGTQPVERSTPQGGRTISAPQRARETVSPAREQPAARTIDRAPARAIERTQPRESAPARMERTQPVERAQPRAMPSRTEPVQRAAPVERSAPTPQQQRSAPMQRSVPQQQRSAPEPRSAPAPQQQRSAPVQRTAPAPQQQRSAPAERAAPAPQQQQRAPRKQEESKDEAPARERSR